jgi:enoyl-CoA hydratase/carnithine racemase
MTEMNIPTFETIKQELRGRVAILTLNRPEAMNAINMKMRSELRTALDELRRDAQVGAVILTGAGEKAFSAGMDLREFAAMNANIPIAEMKRYRWEQGEGIAAFDKPIIAAINGLAIGGGVELTLLCDFAFAADHSSFAFGEVKRGLIPGNGGTQRLSRRVGTARALDMILTGRTVTAAEALSIGLVQYVVPQNELIEQIKATDDVSKNFVKGLIDDIATVSLHEKSLQDFFMLELKDNLTKVHQTRVKEWMETADRNTTTAGQTTTFLSPNQKAAQSLATIHAWAITVGAQAVEPTPTGSKNELTGRDLDAAIKATSESIANKLGIETKSLGSHLRQALDPQSKYIYKTQLKPQLTNYRLSN